MELRYADRPYEISRLRRSVDYVSGTGTLSKDFTINTPDAISSTRTIFLVDYYFALYTVSQVTLNTTYYTVRTFSQDRDKGLLYVGLNTSWSMTMTTIKITVSFSTSSSHTNTNPNFAWYNRYKYTSNNVEKIWNKPFCVPTISASETITDLVTDKGCTGTITERTILLETGNPDDVCSFDMNYYIKTNSSARNMAGVSFNNIDMPQLKGLNLNSSNYTVTNLSEYSMSSISINYNNDNKFSFTFSSGTISANTTKMITFVVTLKGYLNFGCQSSSVVSDLLFDVRKGKLPIKYGDTLHVSCRLNIHSDTGWDLLGNDRFAFNPTVSYGTLITEYDAPISPVRTVYDLKYTMKTTLKVEYERDFDTLFVLPSPAWGSYADLISLSIAPAAASRPASGPAIFSMGHYYNEKPLFTWTSGSAPSFTEDGYIASRFNGFSGFTMGFIEYNGYSEGYRPRVTVGKPPELRLEPLALLENGAVFLVANGTPFSWHLNASYRLGVSYIADNIYIPAGKLNTANDGAVTPTWAIITATKPSSSTTAKTIYLNGGSYFYNFSSSFSTGPYMWLREDPAETPGKLDYASVFNYVENLDPGFVSLTLRNSGNWEDGTAFYYYDWDAKEWYEASWFYSSDSAWGPSTITVKTKDNSGGISETNPVLFFIWDYSSAYIWYGLLTTEY